MKIPADEFVIQAREHLAALEQVLLSLEGPCPGPGVRDRIDRCLRIVHSIKGDAGFLGFSAIRTLADAMETALEAMRDPGEGPPEPAAVERLLLARDRLASLVDDLGGGDAADLDELLAELARVARPSSTGSGRWDVDLREVDRLRSGRLADFFSAFERLGRVSAPEVAIGECDLADGLPSGPVRFRVVLSSEVPGEEIRRALGLPAVDPPSGPGGVVPLAIDLAAWQRSSGRTLATLLAELDRSGRVEGARLDLDQGDLCVPLAPGPVVLRAGIRTELSKDELARRLGLPTRAEAPEGAVPALTPPPPPPDGPSPAPAAGGPAAAEPERAATLRINVELLDRLMTLASELTLIRNQSLLAFDLDDDRVRPIVQRLDAVTSALQETVLRTRMQPIGNLFGKFPRVVRDLARQLGKQVEVRLVGRDVELDKTILEQLSDPLTHLVRNAVDHGIEPPADRRAAGKPEVGRITLSAAHEEGRIRVEIRDDGRGLDPRAIREKALALRLKTEAELDRMSDRELSSLVLLPGFSTARAVSEVSGRGVGMDVVKTNVEHLEGTLTIESRPGLGTAMVLRLPLTLAIIPCLIVTEGGERYAVPQRDLEEVACLHPRLAGRIERAFDREVYRLRGRLLPIVRLGDVLARRRAIAGTDRAEPPDGHEEGPSGRVSYILVLRSASRRFGLVVDEVRGTEEVVVKPMHPALKPIGLFSGATIMGDGRVALIVDVAGVAEHARPGPATAGADADADADADAGRGRDATGAAQPQRVLLFEHGPHEQFALPLLQIRRVEMADLGRVERVGEHEYIAVDGVSTRLLRLDRVMDVSAPAGGPTPGGDAAVPLILPKFVPQPMAILASRIVDTESLAVALQSHPEQDRGLLGSAPVRGRMTLFLDVHHLASRLFGGPPAPPVAGSGRAGRPRRLLLLDDTPFFLEVVRRYLTEQGHEVETATDGREGLARVAAGPPFDLIVSDIEMPAMDGWEFARELRRRGVETPLLALTSLSGRAHEDRARECGFDDFEVKLDRDRLVGKVEGLLASRGARA